MSNENYDYSTGEVRRHHTFYFEEADICIQVEKAIFKVHRFFLAQRSVVLRDMLQTPQATGSRDGADERPLVFTGDSVTGWEGLFQSIYSPNFLKSEEAPTGKTLIAVLRLAHKYCMELIEEEILSHLKKTVNKEDFLNLLLCSQIIGSTSLYDQAIAGLVRHREKITLEEARHVGFEALHRIAVSPDPLWDDLMSGGSHRIDLPFVMALGRRSRGPTRGRGF